MALKHYNPTSPSRRGLILIDRTGLHKGGPVKALTEGKRKTGGRNNKGHVTSRGIAGGHKQRYRFIDFKRSEEHTSELQSLMRISYAVFCLKKKQKATTTTTVNTQIHHIAKQ